METATALRTVSALGSNVVGATTQQQSQLGQHMQTLPIWMPEFMACNVMTLYVMRYMHHS